MKLFKIVTLIVISIIIWDWINADGVSLTLVDIIPFSVHKNHSFEFNYVASVAIIITILIIIKKWSKNDGI